MNHCNPLSYKRCVRCRRLVQRREARSNRARSARGDFAMEQRREALTEREAREVILRGIDAQ